jgi:Fe-S-cluster containining protein
LANEFTRKADITYRRDSPFSYECHACSRCCYDKVIQLNPYEVARLARNRSIGTTEFLARFTERSGTALRRTQTGACVFLTPQGCSVHSDRPLVCRLYPLGRKVSADSEETFRQVEPHPQTEGVYGENGTVQDFLDRQGVQPFIEAVDRYVELTGRMVSAVHLAMNNNDVLRTDVQSIVEDAGRQNVGTVPDWFDMDRVLARFCTARHISVPSDMTEKMNLHIQAVGEQVSGSTL